MGGALIETSARKLKNEANKETAIRMIKRGKLTIEEIAEYTVTGHDEKDIKT